ncbi:hypothetical protein D8B26_006716 [Coccidioides posadasii str. Silveira]|nr:hypothetical protein D8B26_006716 [Coccidioides posadasii str. Silveira]
MGVQMVAEIADGTGLDDFIRNELKSAARFPRDASVAASRENEPEQRVPGRDMSAQPSSRPVSCTREVPRSYQKRLRANYVRSVGVTHWPISSVNGGVGVPNQAKREGIFSPTTRRTAIRPAEELSSSSQTPTPTITFDFTSFTTDNQQSTWPPQPPSSQQPPAPSNPLHAPHNDFVLFPAPSRIRDWNSPQANPPRPAVPLNPASARNFRRHSFLAQQHQHKLQARSSGSPVAQDPRVASIIGQSQGLCVPSTWSPPRPRVNISPQQRRNALLLARGASPHSVRPPVPLFPGTGSSTPQHPQTQHHRRAMSTSNLPLDIGTLLDLSTDQYVEDLGSSSHGSLLDQDQLDQLINFNSVVEQMPAQTVSPNDLMMDSSAPPSTSFTDMSTPSFESPGYFSHDTSPLIATDSDLGPGHEEWESLFPVESAMLPKFDEKVPLCSPKAPSALITPMTRTASSPGASPRNSRSSTRPSSISGVKPRNRDKPLPPIVYDTSDPVAAKRARNTEAARKSRARKVELQEQMERRIAELEKALEDSRQREAYWKSLAETQQ